jgi:hypothetical protein
MVAWEEVTLVPRRDRTSTLRISQTNLPTSQNGMYCQLVGVVLTDIQDFHDDLPLVETTRYSGLMGQRVPRP